MERLRRVTYWSLATGVVIAWLGPLTWLLTSVETDTLALWRLPLLGVVLPFYTVLYLRAIRRVVLSVDRRREVVACGVLALIITTVTAQAPWPEEFPMRAWQLGMVVTSWAGLAALGVSRSRAVLLCGSVVGVGLLLTPAEYWPMIVVPLALMSAVGIWANRFQLWIWELLQAAERGREAQTALAVTEERLRFSRDLHDVVGHSLSAIAVKSELAARLAAKQPERAEAEMVEVRQLARESLREIRAVVRGYRTVDLDAELRSARAVLNAAEIRTELVLPGTRLPDEVSTVIAWLVREGTTNVLRHSTASRCRIAVTLGEAGVELEMRNDGVTAGRATQNASTTLTTRANQPLASEPSEARVHGRGSGTTGMTERVTALGGTLSAGPGSRPDEYVLRATIPLPDDRVPHERVPHQGEDTLPGRDATPRPTIPYERTASSIRAATNDASTNVHLPGEHVRSDRVRSGHVRSDGVEGEPA